MSARNGEPTEIRDLNERLAAKRRFLFGTAVGCILALIALNGGLLWRMKTGVPFSTEFDLTRPSKGSTIELRGLFPGKYHLAIEFSLPIDFEDAKSFHRGVGAKRIHQDLDVDLELVLTDERGKSLLVADGGTQDWKIYNGPHLEHTDGGLERFFFEASPLRSYALRTAVLRANPSALPYHASLLLYAEGIEYLGIKTAIYNSLLLIALVMIVVLVWAHRFGESDEDVPSLPSE